MTSSQMTDEEMEREIRGFFGLMDGLELQWINKPKLGLAATFEPILADDPRSLARCRRDAEACCSISCGWPSTPAHSPGKTGTVVIRRTASSIVPSSPVIQISVP